MQSRTAGPGVSRGWQLVIPCVVIALAVILRGFRLGFQSVWYDEAFTIHAAAVPLNEMLRILVDDFNHPPLHTLLVHAWFQITGVGVVQARALSAIFGVASVGALY